jgi:hypothetical protein
MADNREASLFHINDYNSGSSINKNQAIKSMLCVYTSLYYVFVVREVRKLTIS